MKKTLLTATVLAGLLGSSAFADTTVSSANVVGYSKVDLAPGFTMMRTPFADGTNALSIQSILSTNDLTAASIAGVGDQIVLWNNVSSQYDTYFLHDGTNGKLSVPEKLGKWVDATTDLVASNSVAPGTGFFFIRAGATTVTNLFSGDAVVADTGTNTLTLLEGFNMVANPFSSEFDLNGTVTNWIEQGAIAGSIAGVGDQILLWDPVESKYDTYFLHDGTNGKLSVPEKLGKWVDASTDLVVSNSVPLNSAFFYSRTIGESTLTIEIKQPYDLD
jgi:hypothetical protein